MKGLMIMKHKYIALVMMLFIFTGVSYAANTKPPVIVIDYAYEDARDFHEGLAAVKQNGRWGYIDYLGRIAIPFIFRGPDAGDFSDGFAFVEDHYIDTEGNQAFGRINEDTDERIERYFTNGKPFSQGLAAVQSGGQWGYIDLMGNYVISPMFERAGRFVDGLAPAMKGGYWGYINMRGVFVIEPKYIHAEEFSEGYAAVNLLGRWGYIDKSGKFIIRPAYSEAGNFSQGIAPVRSRTNYRGWGYVRPNGKFSIPRRYNSAGQFSEGLAPVAADRRWGYVNLRAEWEISAQFDEARAFSEGLAAVRREKLWGYIRP